MIVLDIADKFTRHKTEQAQGHPSAGRQAA
jgi:hypothetical protein